MTDDWHFSRFNTILLSKRRLTIFSMTYPSRQIQIQTLFVKLVNLSNNISAFLQPNASSCLWLDYWTLLLISCLTPVLVSPPLISYNRDSPSERFTDLASPHRIKYLPGLDHIFQSNGNSRCLLFCPPLIFLDWECEPHSFSANIYCFYTTLTHFDYLSLLHPAQIFPDVHCPCRSCLL